MNRIVTLLFLTLSVVIVFPDNIEAAKNYRARPTVNVKVLKLRVAPSISAKTVPRMKLRKGDAVTILEKKGSWRKIKPERAEEPVGWVRYNKLVAVDRGKTRDAERNRDADVYARGSQAGYGSGAAARGISSLGKKMTEAKVITKKDTKLADKVTEYLITGIPREKNARRKAMKKKVKAFMKESKLGIYLP